MTTIIYDGKTLISDSLMLQGNIILGECDKIFELDGGILFAGAGGFAFINEVKNWLVGDCDKPVISDDTNFSGVVVYPDGTHHELERDLVHFRTPLPVVIGSGQDLARGAMLAGANVFKAMEAVCKGDSCSAKPLKWYTLKNGKFRYGQSKAED